MPKRRLTKDEIVLLKDHGCRAEDWTRIKVHERFSPKLAFRFVTFSGDIELGEFGGEFETPDGMRHLAGVFQCRLHNVSIGDNCLIRNSDIANAVIGPGAIVNRVGLVACSGPTAFANGESVNVLSETGGRSVPLWRRLSSQIAHLLCHFRGRPEAAALLETIRRDVESLSASRSVISAGCRVERCGLLRNVYLEEGAVVDGASSLADCYIASSREAPAFIGEGVAAERCIFQRASRTDGGVRLAHCLVGEGAKLRRGFSAEHSLFFANSDLAQGEAVSVMAGPFTTSHHKASLLLACQCSFINFGSGANASNHHFKLGPVHGGIMERGVKLGSGSYLYWPSAIGAYSTVVGRNNRHLDTRDFPFSLVIGEGNQTLLVPAVNLFAIGLFRDARKWPERDARAGVAEPLDFYQAWLGTPYVLQAIDRGVDILATADDGDLEVGGAIIPEGRVGPALRIYRASGVYYTGVTLMEHVTGDGGGKAGLDAVAAALAAGGEGNGGVADNWRDWGGLLVPEASAERFLADLADGSLADPERLQAALAAIHAAYLREEWRWLARRWRRLYGRPDRDSIRAFLREWREATVFRHDCLLKDAAKEFTSEAAIGFGVEQERDSEFRQARGELASHPLVAELNESKNRCLAFAAAMIEEGGSY